MGDLPPAAVGIPLGVLLALLLVVALVTAPRWMRPEASCYRCWGRTDLLPCPHCGFPGADTRQGDG
jgi:hypothetical protein